MLLMQYTVFSDIGVLVMVIAAATAAGVWASNRPTKKARELRCVYFNLSLTSVCLFIEGPERRTAEAT
jgi:hypothetical protein